MGQKDNIGQVIEFRAGYDNRAKNKSLWNKAQLMALKAGFLEKPSEYLLYATSLYNAMVWGILSDPNRKEQQQYEKTERGIKAWLRKLGKKDWGVQYRLPNEYETHLYPTRTETWRQAALISEYVASDEFLDEVIKQRKAKGEPYDHLLKMGKNNADEE